MRCPICKSEHTPAGPRLGPFCSERCQLIDLGQWLGEEYRVPDSTTAVSEEDVEAAMLAQERAAAARRS
jgi:endogenous inhibitor of DNA gyrase (YacG/DUF329 family)